MVCPKCGSDNFDAISKIKKRGFIKSIIYILLTICTCGLWLILGILRGGTSSKTMFVCKNCGKEFNAQQGNKAQRKFNT